VNFQGSIFQLVGKQSIERIKIHLFIYFYIYYDLLLLPVYKIDLNMVVRVVSLLLICKMLENCF